MTGVQTCALPIYFVVLCVGSMLLLTPVVRSANVSGINLQINSLSPTVRFNLGFFLRENLLLHSSHLPLGVSQRSPFTSAGIKISGAVAGEEEAFCKGSLSLSISLLCFCFALFILFCLVCFFISKTQKKLVSFIAVVFASSIIFHHDST